MVQSFNFPAIRAGVRAVLCKRQLLYPHVQVKDITRIDYGKLKHSGCKYIVFDKDNCVTEPYELQVFPKFETEWQHCLDTFGSKNVAIFSNSAGSSDDVDFKDASMLEDALKVKVIRHGSKKPNGGDAILNHFNAASEKVAFVGDRILTDVVFGNINGFFTIHTMPFSLKRDNFAAKQIRRIENWLITDGSDNAPPPPPHPIQKKYADI